MFPGVAPDGFNNSMYNDANQSVISFTGDGAVYSWGSNTNGALGRNDSNLKPSVIQKGLDGVRITQVSCGSSFSLALSDKGQVV